MKKIIKMISLILLILILSVIIIEPICQAVNWDFKKFDDIGAGSQSDQAVTNVIGAAVNIASTIAAGLAIIILVVLGIKYITSNYMGQAEIKKTLTNYAIGVIILFGTSGILRIIQVFIDRNLNDIDSTTSGTE